MRLGEYDVPDDLWYTKEHEWARKTKGQTVRIGITDYAAKTLNDVVYVAPSKPKDAVVQFQSIGTVESIKAVSELYSPVSGTVAAVNGDLESHPELVNKSPYVEGWLIDVVATDFASDCGRLLGPKQYAAHLETLLKQ